jgi:[acyl-carrier-protein] S-malonyltransferase
MESNSSISNAAMGIGLVFPGQGSQSVGMGKAFYETVPAARTVFEQASTVLGYDAAALCFEGPAERLNLTEYTQPALLTASIAALRTLDPFGVCPLAVAGHSLGEYSALVAAGGCSFEAGLALVQKRGRYMSEAVAPGSGLVAAVLGATPEAVREACEQASSTGIVKAANFNSPGQIVIAGAKAAVEQAMQILKAKGGYKVIPLPVSVPVHTPLMQPAADRLAKDIEATAGRDLSVPLINNAEAKPLQQWSDVARSLVRQLPSSVLWEQSVKVMQTLGVKTFIEVGPGAVLSGLIRRIVPGAVTLNVNDPQSLEATMNALSVKRSDSKEGKT